MLQVLVRLLLSVNELTANFTQTPLRRARRVVGGELAVVEQLPYLVNIRKNGAFECGGSLITPHCVLTAAHCVKENGPQDFIVRAGVTYLSDLRNSRKVSNIFIPTEYNSTTLEHDIAVFRLQSKFAGKHIRVIELADTSPQADELVRVSGWGLTSENATKPSNRMRAVQVRVMPQLECQELYAGYRNVTELMFCASIPGYADACSADSGGPAVYNGRLVGVVSWGKGYECARAETPGVYMNVPRLRYWLDTVMRKHCH